MYASRFKPPQANGMVKLRLIALDLHTQQVHTQSRRLPDTGSTPRCPSTSAVSQLWRQTRKGVRPPTRSSTSSAGVQRRFLHSTQQVTRFVVLCTMPFGPSAVEHVQEPTARCPHDRSAAEPSFGRQACGVLSGGVLTSSLYCGRQAVTPVEHPSDDAAATPRRRWPDPGGAPQPGRRADARRRRQRRHAQQARLAPDDIRRRICRQGR